MVFAALLGLPLGASAGIIAGNYFFGKVINRQAQPFLKQCDQSADDNDEIPFPDTAGKPVSFFKQTLLKDTSPALKQPDYERALFINKILQILWPHLSPAIHKEVMKQAKVPIEEALANISLIEDIRIDKVDLGERPFRVDSFKTFETKEDEIIIETPAFWGGDLHLRLTAVVKLGPLRIDVPVDIANIQFKALMRITMRPLVETLPCVGGVTLSLLEEPQINFTLKLIDSPDIMCLLGVPLAIKAATSIVASRMFVYPNEFSVPLMPNFGLPYPPIGMLSVKAVSGHDLKSSMFDKVDPFLVLEIRKGRRVQTNVIQNEQEPKWNETMDLVVDDPRTQHLKVIVYDEDVLSPDVVGGIKIDMNNSEFMQNPGKSVRLRLPVFSPAKDGEFPVANPEDVVAAMKTAATDAAVMEAISSVPKRRGLIGKLVQRKQTKAAVAKAMSAMNIDPSSNGTSSFTRSQADGGASPTASTTSGMRESSFSFHATTGGDDDDDASSLSERKRPPPLTVTGSVTLEVTFYPFKGATLPPLPEDEAQQVAADAADAAASAADEDVKGVREAAVAGGGEVAEAGIEQAIKSSKGESSTATTSTTTTAATTTSTTPSKHAALEEKSASIPTPLRRTLNSMQSSAHRPDRVRGILTVDLKKVMHLGTPVNSYVVLKLYDPHRLPVPDIIIKTKVELYEASPRFNFKADFVNISAASVLTATVYSQPGVFDALTSLKVPFLQQASPPMLGKVRVPLNDVVKEGRVKDVYPLQEAQTGEMHLTLEWTAVDMDVDVE